MKFKDIIQKIGIHVSVSCCLDVHVVILRFTMNKSLNVTQVIRIVCKYLCDKALVYVRGVPFNQRQVSWLNMLLAFSFQLPLNHR